MKHYPAYIYSREPTDIPFLLFLIIKYSFKISHVLWCSRHNSCVFIVSLKQEQTL